MSVRTSVLNRDPLPWLLEKDNPSVRVFDLLTRLGYRDPRMQDAAELILSKQDASGRWNPENTYNGKFQVDIEKQGKPSKWVTLIALRALKRYLASEAPGSIGQDNLTCSK